MSALLINVVCRSLQICFDVLFSVGRRGARIVGNHEGHCEDMPEIAAVWPVVWIGKTTKNMARCVSTEAAPL